MELVIHSRFNRPVVIPCPIGDGILRQYETRIKDGKRVIEVTSEASLFDKVQEALPDTLVYNILARYERGDMTALTKVHGQYMDVVGMPSTLAEAQQLLIDIRNDFESMPPELRRRFNNSVDEFIESVSTGKAAEVFKEINAATASPVDDNPPAFSEPPAPSDNVGKE